MIERIKRDALLFGDKESRRRINAEADEIKRFVSVISDHV
jgi:hypothetical protein